MITGKLPVVILAVTLALVACVSCAPNPKESGVRKPVVFDSFDIPNESDLYPANSNNILPYNPVDPKPVRVELSPPRENNKMKSDSYVDWERDFTEIQSRRPTVANVMAQGDDAERSGSPNVDKIKDIAMNSREVRLVGPNQKEVEMKDDVPTKIVVALENLQKEAQEVFGQVNEKLDKGWTELKRSEVWGQMNEKLDKGWTDFKSMVEGVVAPSSKSG